MPNRPYQDQCDVYRLDRKSCPSDCSKCEVAEEFGDTDNSDVSSDPLGGFSEKLIREENERRR